MLLFFVRRFRFGGLPSWRGLKVLKFTNNCKLLGFSHGHIYTNGLLGVSTEGHFSSLLLGFGPTISFPQLHRVHSGASSACPRQFQCDCARRSRNCVLDLPSPTSVF